MEGSPQLFPQENSQNFSQVCFRSFPQKVCLRKFPPEDSLRIFPRFPTEDSPQNIPSEFFPGFLQKIPPRRCLQIFSQVPYRRFPLERSSSKGFLRNFPQKDSLRSFPSEAGWWQLVLLSIACSVINQAWSPELPIFLSGAIFRSL